MGIALGLIIMVVSVEGGAVALAVVIALLLLLLLAALLLPAQWSSNSYPSPTLTAYLPINCLDIMLVSDV
jgi:hypothetical protein